MMLRKLLLAALALLALPVWADVTHNVTATPVFDGNPDTLFSLATTITPTGADRLVLAAVYAQGQSVAPTVTYGAQSMTLIASGGDGFEPWLWYYYVVPTGSGVRTVTATWLAGAGRAALGVVAYNGVDQTTPIGNFGSTYTDTPGTAHPTTVTTVTGQLVADMALVAGSNITAAAGQTVRADVDDAASMAVSFGMSDKPATGTSTSTGWNTTGAEDGSVIAVAMNPAAGGGGPVMPLFYNHQRQLHRK